MEIDRRALIKSLGGAAAVALMTSEQKAEALEHYMMEQLDEPDYPTVSQLEEKDQDLTRPYRNGAGGLFRQGRDGKLKELPPMPEKPTLYDFFEYRFAPANHVLQSAKRAQETGMKEEVILACLLHDVVLNLIRPDHGWWGAQLIEPYVPAETAFAVRYHQCLRFFPDPEYGYEYPESYFRTFGEDYVPEAYLQKTHDMVRNHKWYEYPRLVTVNDLYAFDRNAKVSIDPFREIIARHFKQPEEGLGYDNSPSSHMWRSMIQPDRRL